MVHKQRIRHVIPYELSGLATLLVDYLSRWGEEVELLSVLLASLIIGLLLDAEGLLNNPWIGAIYALVIVGEFVFTLAVAYRRRELEYELWRAAYELERSGITAGNNRDNR